MSPISSTSSFAFRLRRAIQQKGDDRQCFWQRSTQSTRQRSLTRDVVSERAGISCSVLSKLETGVSVSAIETRRKLANSISVPPPVLLLRIGILQKDLALRALATARNGSHSYAARHTPMRLSYPQAARSNLSASLSANVPSASLSEFKTFIVRGGQLVPPSTSASLRTRA